MRGEHPTGGLPQPRGAVHQALRRRGSLLTSGSRHPAAPAERPRRRSRVGPRPPAHPRAYPLAVVLLAAVAHDSGLLSPLLAFTEAVKLPPSLQRLRRSLARRHTLRVAQSRHAPHHLLTGLTLPDVTPRSLTWSHPLPRRRAFLAPPTSLGLRTAFSCRSGFPSRT